VSVSPWLLDGLVVLTVSAVLLALASPRIRHSNQWQATVTPLASIIGSGFLLVAPLLHASLGKWALAGIVVLTFVAYNIGIVIRFNIVHAEVWVEEYPQGRVARIEALSQWMLGLAYTISVAFYASLLAAFVFEKLGISNGTAMRWAATGLLTGVMAVAWARGAKGLEMIELVAVTIKIAIIGGVLLALAYYDAATGIAWFEHEPLEPLTPYKTAAILAGMLMVTQGFETARFMGERYTREVRVLAVKQSQWIATAIYVVFIGVTCPIFFRFPIAELNETAVSTTLGQVIFVLPAFLLVAASASQLSAALADTIGGGGLFQQRLKTKTRLPSNAFYVIVAGMAIVLLWTADVFELVNYASKGFAAYYLLQVVIAIGLVARRGSSNRLWLVGLVPLALLLIFVVLGSIAAPHS